MGVADTMHLVLGMPYAVTSLFWLLVLGVVLIIAAVALFSFLYTFNDFFLPLLYTGETAHHWVLSIGLSELVPPAKR